MREEIQVGFHVFVAGRQDSIGGVRKVSPELVVHVEAAAEGHTQIEALHGERHSVSSETARRCACDASVRVMTHATDGTVLDVGRKTRRISPALRHALSERDRGCRFPACPHLRTDGHHIEHWADGGETKLQNIVSLCRFHHVQLHEGGFTVTQAGASLIFVRPNGAPIAAAGTLPPTPTFPQKATPSTTPWRGIDWLNRYADIPRAVESLIAQEQAASTASHAAEQQAA